MNKLKATLLVSYVGEHISGGFYLRLAHQARTPATIRERLKSTAGDETRHGEYFNDLHEQEFGNRFSARPLLISLGKVFGSASRIIPLKHLLHWVATAEATVVKALEKDVATKPSTPYLQLVTKILPDERTHAEPYTL
ncbi:MAG: hypothetical protein COB04_05370 [Gammaproteobacteria bacterium]|nr:MAG: hypothetical protein COB04_05370 [Gammaproteobacteria bacterium]